MPSVQWMKPAPLWDDAAVDLKQPWLAESKQDSFLADFLSLMAGNVPGQTPANLRDWQPELTENRLKLYQPLHGRYYLVTASLVCRQLGLPDRQVARQNGEKTSFVLRRTASTGEQQGWVPGAGWTTVAEGAVLPGEERLPMHPVDVCPGPAPSAPALPAAAPVCAGRRVYYGYIPVAGREKYIAPLPDPGGALQALLYPPSGGSPPTKELDPRMGEVIARVIGPWKALCTDSTPGADVAKGALYLILDLGAFLLCAMPDLFLAILNDSNAGLSGGTLAFYDELNKLHVPANGNAITLPQAIRDRQSDLALVQGQGSEPTGVVYDMAAAFRRDGNPATDTLVSANNAAYLAVPLNLASPPAPPALYDYCLAAAQETGTVVQLPAAMVTLRQTLCPNAPAGRGIVVPSEVADMIKDDAAGSAPSAANTYMIRLVYEHPPCDPVLSAPSDPFTFARALDPDAPARHIRIQLPDLADLRKFKRGIGMEMPASLRTVMDGVNKGMLTGGGLNSPPEWELAMICSFSLPIITLVAFIVMFIFLILLNFVFWWLPFLKICFPIPVKKS